MKKALKYVLLSCFIFLLQEIEGKAIFQYGLTFNSYEVEKEERTSLNLSPEKPFSFPNGYILEFDVSFNREYHSFGYVLRIIGNDEEYIDLLFNRTRNSEILEPQVTAIYKSGQVLCNYTFEALNTDFYKWIKVKLIIDPKKQLFKLSLDEKNFEKTENYFSKLQNINIIFGKNDLLSYETSDVPSMSIRDISIKNINGKQLYYWKLAQHTENGVYDEIKNHFASCKSPKWILDNHVYWKKINSFNTEVYPQITFNKNNNEIVIADQQNFYIYNIMKDLLNTKKNERGSPLLNKSNQFGYNSINHKYFSYDFFNPVILYDTLTKTWDYSVFDKEEPHYWHHNHYYFPTNNTLYTWGGYGFHIYKNDIHTYNFNTNTWNRGEYKGDSIPPRYLAGLGLLDEKTVLIFGGYGSEKGSQALSPRNYYDLYSYNLETSQTKKIWELNAKEHNFVVANSLVVDSLNNCFYALCFPHQKFNTTLQLYRFSLAEPIYEIMADNIPYQFSDISSYADLYLSNDNKQLVAITSYTDEKINKGVINIYTLAFPPLNEANLFQQSATSGKTFLYVIVILAFMLLFVVIFVYNFRKKEAKDEATKSNPVEETREEENYAPIVGIKPLHEKPNKQSIILFGGFQVTDKESNNITGEFTPTLKHLFLLILFYTLKDGKGISSVKLREILWFDKSNESAKNNRGVSLSKLRIIFEKIGEISVSSINSYWVIKFDKAIYCDYYEALILMDRLTMKADLKDLNRFIAIVSAGELLPNLQTEWIDTFKSDFSNKLIDLLLSILQQSSDLGLTPTTMINISDAIFVHDSLNEDALKIKCSVLVKMGKNGLAQKTYNSFIKEYQSLFGVDFKLTFEQVIS